MSFSIEEILKKDYSTRKKFSTQDGVYENSVFIDSPSTSWTIPIWVGNFDRREGEHSCLICQSNGSNESPKSCKGEISSTKRKRRRILFTREQTRELEKVFRYQQYLTIHQREYLAKKINLSSTQVKIWFQNHRYKLKKYFKDHQIENQSNRCCCEECGEISVYWRHKKTDRH